MRMAPYIRNGRVKTGKTLSFTMREKNIWQLCAMMTRKMSRKENNGEHQFLKFNSGKNERAQMTSNTPDKRFAAVCGLFCPACTFFIGTKEDPERLKAMAIRLQRPVDELECSGCRSNKLAFYCRKYCKMKKCAAKRGVDFCGECSEYPCVELKAFQVEMPHRIELWKSQERIKEVGYEKWYGEMIEHYTCTKCGALNSAYDIVCRICGSTPSSNYVKLHKDEIVKNSGKLRL
jgi:hypothetical protein